MLTVALFLLQIGLVYAITGRFFGLFAARILALAYGTSAGIIAFSHFLTADIPLATWMLAAFYFAQNVLLRGRLLDYVMAGALTGIAAATKYNGLVIGVTFVVAHALTIDPRQGAPSMPACFSASQPCRSRSSSPIRSVSSMLGRSLAISCTISSRRPSTVACHRDHRMARILLARGGGD